MIMSNGFFRFFFAMDFDVTIVVVSGIFSSAKSKKSYT